jgi:hypothetical protein
MLSTAGSKDGMDIVVREQEKDISKIYGDERTVSKRNSERCVSEKNKYMGHFHNHHQPSR